jgi:PIN domain nuclease of toxin-antitoxin system
MIILNTHAWIWCVNQSEKLTKNASQAISDADRIVEFKVIYRKNLGLL